MKINFKFLIIPLSFIVLCGNNNLSAMEDDSSTASAMLSFRNNEALNDIQTNFILEMSNKVYNDVYHINDYYTQMKLSKEDNKINTIKTKYFDNFVSKYFKEQKSSSDWNVFPQDIYNDTYVNKFSFKNKDEYLTFIKRINDCYNAKLIDKEHYISLLTYLLYCNTNYIIEYLNKNVEKNIIKSSAGSYNFGRNKIINITVQDFKSQLIDMLYEKAKYGQYPHLSITKFVNNCVYGGVKYWYWKLDDDIKTNEYYKDRHKYSLEYENYKLIVNSIIKNLIPLLITNTKNDEDADVFDVSKKLEIITEQIIEPIKLGIYSHAFKLESDQYLLNGCYHNKEGLIDINSPVSCYKEILCLPKVMKQINEEFNITKTILDSDEYKKFLNKKDEIITYNKFMYDKTNDLNAEMPFKSFNLFREKVKKIVDDDKLPKNQKREPYKHSDALINNKKGNNNEYLTDNIMSYVSKTKMPKSIEDNITKKLNANNPEDSNYPDDETIEANNILTTNSSEDNNIQNDELGEWNNELNESKQENNNYHDYYGIAINNSDEESLEEDLMDDEEI